MIKGWIRHSFADFHLNFAWEMARTEVLVLYGASGAGKTTILKVLAGLLKPDAGRMVIDDFVVHDIEKGIWLPTQHRGIGYVPQTNNVFPHLTVEQNVSFGVSANQKGRVVSLLKSFDLEALKQRRPRHLSGGEIQRTAIARALAPLPKLLLFDEPFMGMDLTHRNIFKRELNKVTEDFEVPVIVVTHWSDEAMSIADRVLVVDKGEVIAHGLPVPTTHLVANSDKIEFHHTDNFYKATVLSNPGLGQTMTCVAEGVELVVKRTESKASDIVRLTLPPADVIVAVKCPVGIGIENVIKGTLVGMNALDDGVMLEVDSGFYIRAYIHHDLVLDLNLTLGCELWVLAKASSFKVMAGDVV